MAEFSIDQKKLPGVKEVCRDFAVLEDHCLAHNLQEQEIESHLASNVHKSRLAQHDLKVAKLLQEEEDLRAKVQNKRQYRDIERQDNEIAQEIQEELVRQAEQQRHQEEKDAAIARKLQEKEMKEERKRQKQLEANLEEEYYEDEGASRGPPDDKGGRPPRSDSRSPGRFNDPPAVDHHTGSHPLPGGSSEPKSRCQRQDPAAPHGRSKYPKHYLVAEGGRSTHADPYPEHSLPPRGKHGDRYPDNQGTEACRVGGRRMEDAEKVVRRKERPARPPYSPSERDRDWERGGHDRDGGRLGGKGGERDLRRHKERGREGDRVAERSGDGGLSGDRHRERDRRRDEDRQHARTRSQERVLDEDSERRKNRLSWEEEEEDCCGGGGDDDDGKRGRRAGGRHRVLSGPEKVFEENGRNEGRGETRVARHPRSKEGPGRDRCHTHPPGETGRIVHRAGGTIVAGNEFGLSDATAGLTRLDLREQELIDMEVARRLQEEEIKASKKDKHAAQVAHDEEMARLLMEQEKKEYKKIKEKERERDKERERERLAMERMATERKRQEAALRANAEEVVRPRSRGEYEHQRQRNQNKPSRPPQPRTPNYENVNSSSPYGYSDSPFTPRAPSRPEAAYKGAYYRQ